MLHLIEYADYDIQSKLGKGVINLTGSIELGRIDTLEMKSGTLNNNSKNSIIYRGIENIYGNI